MITKDNWLKHKIRYWIYKIVGIKYGPAMLQIRGEWLFIDTYGQIWRLSPTYDHDNPILIRIEYR